MSKSTGPSLSTAFVTVNTWGTHHKGGNGIPHFIDAGFFGGNVGHASVGLTFPADDNTREMIKKYCFKEGEPIVPFERTTMNVMGENGQIEKKEFYNVYFSWWDARFGLVENINADNKLERPGVAQNAIDPRFLNNPDGVENLNPLEQRTERGALGNKQINLSFKQIVHNNETLTPEQKQLVELDWKLNEINQKIKELGIIEKKLALTSAKMDKTAQVLLNKHKIAWQVENPDNPDNLTKEQKERLEKHMKAVVKEAERQRNEYEFEIKQVRGVIYKQYDDKIKDEVKKLRVELSAMTDVMREEFVKDKNSKYSSAAWAEFELQEVRAKIECAEGFKVFSRIKTKEQVLAGIFDNNYPEGMKPIENWRQLLPKGKENITKEEMTDEIYLHMKNEARRLLDDMVEKEKPLILEKKLVDVSDPFLQSNFERFVTNGLPPDNQVVLPIGGINENQNIKTGLNVESMLKKINELAQDNGASFDIYEKNCSVTAGAILEAGAEPELKRHFQRKALQGFGTPQELFNGALQYQNTLVKNKGKLSLGERLAAFNPLNGLYRLASRVTIGALQSDNSNLKRAAYGAALVPLALVVAATQIVKGVFTPKNTFNHCVDFINYARKNNSTLLKVCAVPVGIVAAVVAIPAGIQVAVEKALINPIRSLFKGSEKKTQKPKESAPLGPNMVEISTKDPRQAILDLHNALKNDNKIIPVLSTEAQKNLTTYMASLNRWDPLSASEIKMYENCMSQINMRLNEQAKQTHKAIEQENKVLAPQDVSPNNKRARSVTFSQEVKGEVPIIPQNQVVNHKDPEFSKLVDEKLNAVEKSVKAALPVKANQVQQFFDYVKDSIKNGKDPEEALKRATDILPRDFRKHADEYKKALSEIKEGMKKEEPKLQQSAMKHGN